MKDIIKNNIGKIVTYVLIVTVIALVIGKTFSSNQVKVEEETKVYLSGKHHVVMTVKDLGSMTLELDADVAPITVTNFIDLVNEGFYDGLTFHRVIDGFMIQGGDPNGDGTGGSEEKIKGEFASNGVENNISHVRGVISMARSSDYDSASSQFFIVDEDSTYLDGEYAAFGYVTDGMDVIDKVVKAVKGKTGSNGEVASEDQPIIESIVQID